jgi:hypothetical protein
MLLNEMNNNKSIKKEDIKKKKNQIFIILPIQFLLQPLVLYLSMCLSVFAPPLPQVSQSSLLHFGPPGQPAARR